MHEQLAAFPKTDPITGEIVGKEGLAEGLEPAAEEMRIWLAELANTVKELAEEFGVLVIAGDVDEMNETDAARYNALREELVRRGRDPQNWRTLAEEGAA